MSDEVRVITPDSVNPRQLAMPCVTCDAAPGQECTGVDDVHPKRAEAYRAAMEMSLKDQNRLWAGLAEMEEQKANRPRYEDPDLDAMSARIAATHGGWQVNVLSGQYAVLHSDLTDVAYVGYDDEASAKARAKFMAAAREAMPNLIAELADHRQVRREIHDAMVGIDPAQAEEPTPTAAFIRGLAAELETVRRQERERCAAALEGQIEASEEMGHYKATHAFIDAQRAIRNLGDTDEPACGATWTPHSNAYVCSQPPGHQGAHQSPENTRWLDAATNTTEGNSPGHDFLPVRGAPDDDECTHRADGTDDTYCARPRHEHNARATTEGDQ